MLDFKSEKYFKKTRSTVCNGRDDKEEQPAILRGSVAGTGGKVSHST